MTSELKKYWKLDPEILHLNHGSYSACPTEVLAFQNELRAELELNTTGFMSRRLGPLLNEARGYLSEFIGANPDNLVFVPNTTTGVNAVVRSMTFEKGDEILVTDHGYAACYNIADYVAKRSGAKVVVAKIPFPVDSEAQVVEAIAAAVSPRTRLAIVDHITSPTALTLPLEKLVPVLKKHGASVLVDGAHAPGILDLNIEKFGCDYYVGNCHKWLCAPKGSAFLWVAPSKQDGLVPVTVSLGYKKQAPGQSRFHALFDWTGTQDPSAYLSVPKAIRFVGKMVPGGWPEIRKKNASMASWVRTTLMADLGLDAPCPEAMNSSMVAFPWVKQGAAEGLENLFAKGIELPPKPHPAGPDAGQVLRVSCHLYNQRSDYLKLSTALKSLRSQ